MMADSKGSVTSNRSRSGITRISTASARSPRATSSSSVSAGNSSTGKISSHFQTVEKMNLNAQVRLLSSDDLQQVRYSTNRILQHVVTQEKSARDYILKNTLFIQSLLTCMEVSKDAEVCKNIIGIFAELVGKTNTGHRASQLVSQGVTQVLLQFIVREAKGDIHDDVIIQVHHILSKLALKDRKFGVKARLGQALPVTLSFVKMRTSSHATKNLQPVLTVLKQYSNNALNSSYLGKNGAVSCLFKLLNNLNKKSVVMIKTCVDTLVLLVKSKSNSARAVGHGGVPILLQMYCDWHRLDNKNRHVSMRKSILNVLKHITNLKSGRQAVIDADGVRILYRTCEDIMDVRELESLIFIASLILRKCFPRQKLPVNTHKTTLLYKLPQSDFHNPESLSKDAAQLMGVTLTHDPHDDDDSSLDNDDDMSSDDEREHNKQVCEAIEEVDMTINDYEINERHDEILSRRTVDDLHMYEKFFPEVMDIEVMEEFADSEGHTGLVNSSLLSGIRHNPYSMPNLPSTRYAHVEGGLAGVHTLRIADDTVTPTSPVARSKLQTGVFADVKNQRTLPVNFDSGVSAVNMKTGQPVFSLDFQVNDCRAGTSSARHKSRHAASAKSKKLAACNDSILELSIDQPAAETSDDDLGESQEQIQYDWVTPNEFSDMARKTKSVAKYTKVAYPDLHGSKPYSKKEPLYERKFGVQRAKIFEDIDRMINPDALLNRVVYDFDELIKEEGSAYHGGNSSYENHDELRLGKPEPPYDHLHFSSQFECGNLRKAIQIREYEYDLILCPDINSNHHHQWFYFEISNMKSGKPYRFNIINNEKLNSQFNFGMRPVMYSVQDAVSGKPYWVRTGTDICYFKNHLTRSSQVTGGVRGKLYYTTTFSITFDNAYDVCYLAYHYPYSYTTMQCHLSVLERKLDHTRIYYRKQTLCQTISGNDINVVTITNYPSSYSREGIEHLRNKPYIFLSSRVHPGESNASWVMSGTIEHLLSEKKEAQALRDAFIFKIIPMLNPDGVINGNHRCSLTAEDLNRRWLVTCPKLHPSIYHCKGLLQFMKSMHRTPLVFCDYHGHSRRKNVFLYGCSPTQSWMTDDMHNPASLNDKTEDSSYKTLPRILAQTAPAFSLPNCSFCVEKSKESTARVVVWRQIGVVRSYTMESSYCGCDQGPYNGLHINPSHLQHMGRKFADALIKVKSRHYKPSLNSIDSLADDKNLSLDDLIDSAKQEDKTTEEEYLEDNLTEDEDDDDDDELELNSDL